MRKFFTVSLMAVILATSTSCTTGPPRGGGGEAVGGYEAPSRLQQQDQLERMHRDLLRDAYR